MDITPQDVTQQPISDDQELAKALAGVLPEEQSPTQPDVAEIPALQFEETPAPTPSVTPATADPIDTGFVLDEQLNDQQDAPVSPVHQPSDLDDIKKTALEELRPLMDKVELPADEKFNTYLMLLRSTDDPSLIEPAHQTAKSITDERVRAQALLDIIKEIDYLSQDKIN